MLSHRTLYMHAMGVLVGYLRLGGALPADQKVELHTIPLFHANGWGRPHTVTMMGGRHVMLKRFEPDEVLQADRAGEGDLVLDGADDGGEHRALGRPRSV